MLRIFLGEWGTGRLNQWQFTLFYVAIVVAVFLWAILVFGFAAVAVTQFGPGEIERFAGGYGWAIIGSFLTIVAAWFNIVVKRGRDAGIPGAATGLGFLLLFAFGGLPVFGTILLAVLPSKASANTRA